MTIKHLTMAAVIVAGFFTAKVFSQEPKPIITTSYSSAARFYVSDLSVLQSPGEDLGRAFLVHDRKVATMCTLVIEGFDGGVTTTPKVC